MQDRMKPAEEIIASADQKKSIICVTFTFKNVVIFFICTYAAAYGAFSFIISNETWVRQPLYKPAPRTGNRYPYVIFVQTTESPVLTTLAACAIESAARVYETKRILLYMKGVNGESMKSTEPDPAVHLVSTIPNVEIHHLDPKMVLKGTPLQKWYEDANPIKERFWIHVQSDAFRYALLWHHGGIYLDTDVITLRPMPEGDLLGLQSSEVINGAVLSFRDHSPILNICMEDFVHNYKGWKWGHQGPDLLTRVFQRLCHLTVWNPERDYICAAQNVTILKQSAFYPIRYQDWEKFFSSSGDLSIFQDIYAAHIWNQMNQLSRRSTVRAGDKTLLDKLFKNYCPQTHAGLL